VTNILRLAVTAALVAGSTACAARAGGAVPGSPSAGPTPAAAAAAELPEGRGKEILMASCTSCHDLREVTKFRGYYSRAQWRDIVVTMVEYGAGVEEKDVEVLSDYLEQHLGRGAAATR
jgi:cytochrome c5